MEKNKEYLGEVLSLGSEGEGVIKCDGITAFVPFCLTGERVSFKALKVTKTVAYGKLTEVHTISPDRVAPVCPHFEKCGGCQLQHLAYPAQLEFKRKLVANCLKKIGGLEAEVGQPVASVKQYAYRNKLALPVGTDENGRTVVGFYAPRSHRIIPVSSCAIQSEWSSALIAALTEFMDGEGLTGYDELSKKGDIRHIVGRELDGKLIITLVTTARINLDGFVRKLSESFKKFTLWNNVNSGDGNGIFGKEWRICCGEGYFTGEDEGIKFKAGANTFLQVNDGVRKLLYAAVCDELRDGDTVAIDLYSGGGMLTAMLAKACRAAYGIEIVGEAVECANRLKQLNGLGEKMFNYCGAVEERIDEVFAKTAGYRRAIVCDPPRKGMERSVIKEILRCKAEKVVLISCNPATLARDLGLLCGSLIEQDGKLIKNPDFVPDGLNGYYKITKITPFDMFPQTKHVETLVVLSKKTPDSHINIDVEFGEEEGQFSLSKVKERAEARKPKEKVTYKKIQDYIEKTYGFKVHTAYIAEVKRDLGLPMYDAPNAVEELKRPRAHPTLKMVEAIKETLRHFEII
ncbi:MAG: 23S rRNA (uracil(1939)-C(5))-methyltransferase RlmD [Clostridia bacterium]|nr:23S rRNA (uracil(1939)-C(5))-methyltransferase RlmD [Clostridia bacterium]